MLITLPLIAIGGVWVCIHVIRIELNREASYQQQYGDQWVEQYTQTFGSLSQARTRIGIGIAGIVGIVGAAIWLVKVLKDGGHSQSRAPRPQPNESPVARRVRYKRNALLGIYFGVPAVLFSVMLAIFRMGIFAEHSEEVSLAIFVFIGGYCAVVYGCYWWLRAKLWSEGVLLIAFMPLMIFFVPFVRLLVFRALGLLAAAMVMAPLILVVVVAALPDKSGNSRQRAPWERRRRHRERSRS